MDIERRSSPVEPRKFRLSVRTRNSCLRVQPHFFDDRILATSSFSEIFDWLYIMANLNLQE